MHSTSNTTGGFMLSVSTHLRNRYHPTFQPWLTLNYTYTRLASQLMYNVSLATHNRSCRRWNTHWIKWESFPTIYVTLLNWEFHIWIDMERLQCITILVSNCENTVLLLVSPALVFIMDPHGSDIWEAICYKKKSGRLISSKRYWFRGIPPPSCDKHLQIRLIK